MALTAAELDQQKKQVEEMLGPQHGLGFAKSLFFGHFKGDLLFPYPTLPAEQHARRKRPSWPCGSSPEIILMLPRSIAPPTSRAR